jgi:hypothetical protein
MAGRVLPILLAIEPRHGNPCVCTLLKDSRSNSRVRLYSRRLVLLHLKRPLRFPGSALRDLFFAALRASPFVRDGKRNLERWEKAPAAAA